MATILQFNPGLRAGKPVTTKPMRHGGAEILLFTGIRYERIADAVKADHAKVKATRNTKRTAKSRSASSSRNGSAAALRKRDRLELAD